MPFPAGQTSGTRSLHRLLANLGFTSEETSVYLALTERGTLTTLELSRATGISRTQVYRILESMKDKGFIEEIVDEHRLMAKAIGTDGLQLLITKKQQEVTELTQMFPAVAAELSAAVGISQSETRVQFYRGKQGIRQMVWHTLRARHEVVGFSSYILADFVGEEFFRDWRDAFIKKGLILRDVFSDEYRRSKKASGITLTYPPAHFPSRYVTAETLPIDIQTDFYNDVSAYYNWQEGDVFGVEIYNAKLTAFNTRIFGLIWAMGKALDP